jgi:hypothetical protein
MESISTPHPRIARTDLTMLPVAKRDTPNAGAEWLCDELTGRGPARKPRSYRTRYPEHDTNAISCPSNRMSESPARKAT